MRAVIQRVSGASVSLPDEDGRLCGRIGPGLCVFACAMRDDMPEDADFIARKLASLRVFADSSGKFNLSLRDTGGAVLLVSQFTLAAETTSGTRPSFSKALEPRAAESLLRRLAATLTSAGIQVEQGVFAARMQVHLSNDGPVTIFLDSRNKQ